MKYLNEFVGKIVAVTVQTPGKYTPATPENAFVGILYKMGTEDNCWYAVYGKDGEQLIHERNYLGYTGGYSCKNLMEDAQIEISIRKVPLK